MSPRSSPSRWIAITGVGALFISIHYIIASFWITECTEDLTKRLGIDPNVLSVVYASHNNKSDQLLDGRDYGIDPIYIRLLERARISSEKRLQTSPKKPCQGIVIGPTDGKFRHTRTALENAQRIRNVLAMTRNDISTKLALLTSQTHYNALQFCSSPNVTALKKQRDMKPLGIPDVSVASYLESCLLWNNGTLFDNVLVSDLGDLQPNDHHADFHQGSSTFQLKALASYRQAPYQTSLFLDSDAYPCPDFEKLFAIANHTQNDQRYWQLPLFRLVDLATGLEQFPLDGNRPLWNPGRRQGPNAENLLWDDYQAFVPRNTGVVLLHFQGPDMLASTFAEFVPLVGEHLYNNVATGNQKIVNDQIPFKVALFVFHKLVPNFVEAQLPMHASCRTYPGHMNAGTDGFRNGMFPIQSNGKHCRECHCTPCLITHTVRVHAL